ncbi:phosphoribosylglycinamide formyltransferase [Bdellovibrio reynosensis]|uniref:Phosphoribosylglycinamide formyltransferase n=1 Tax=Bdellovibrio reynosensis TaxID=2835041 RepID=A0ABY4C8T1_9BACT|nr:phosphoribosylglycinamide formyltransferase [Bdellovibrio reynosensis]UOF01189.1 phosphoribosylglycinamide formyltransferase [Bdellovibrio reynosensis]
MNPVRVAIFASGTGSNAMALINKAKELPNSSLTIEFVLSDKLNAPVLEKAKNAGVRTYLIEKKQTREQHEAEILGVLREHHVDWVLLAGYMRLVSGSFLKQLSQWHDGHSQVVNIHPSLLPEYPGKDSIARAHTDKAEKTGVTIHLVDEGMDTGSILLQEALFLNPHHPLQTWAEEIHRLEHKMYTRFLQDLAFKKHPTNHFQETY